MHNYLKKILEEKKRVVANLASDQVMLSQLDPILSGANQGNYCAAFSTALSQPGMQVIAEVKRKSPSKGELAAIENPLDLVKTYETSGAAAISVLTDQYGFSGSIEDLAGVASVVTCPVLRKDFIIDHLQIAEAIYHGAAAVLLIVAVLGDQTQSFIEACYRMGIDALVEVHNETELEIAVAANAKIIGVNNRNLHTFEVDLNTALRLHDLIPHGVLSVAESGIKDVQSARLYRDAHFDAVLVGEALVTAKSPALFIQEIMHA